MRKLIFSASIAILLFYTSERVVGQGCSELHSTLTVIPALLLLFCW